MRAGGCAAILAFAVGLVAACGGKVSEGSNDGGPTGGDECSRYCHVFDGTACPLTVTVEACEQACADQLTGCEAEGRAFFSCAVRPGNLTCDGGPPPFLAGCDPELIVYSQCRARHDAGGSSGGGGGSTGGSSPGSSGSAPSH